MLTRMLMNGVGADGDEEATKEKWIKECMDHFLFFSLSLIRTHMQLTHIW